MTNIHQQLKDQSGIYFLRHIRIYTFLNSSEVRPLTGQ